MKLKIKKSLQEWNFYPHNNDLLTKLNTLS